MLTCRKMVLVSLSSLSRMERGRNLNTQHHTPHFRSALYQRRHLHKAEMATTAFHRPPCPDTGGHCWPRALPRSAKATEAVRPGSPPELSRGPRGRDTAETPTPPARTQGHHHHQDPLQGTATTTLGNGNAGAARGAGAQATTCRESALTESALPFTLAGSPRPAPSCLSLFLKTTITRSIY